MSDDQFISKQAAMNLANELQISVDGYHLYNQAINNYCAEIADLPEAIVRCKDCRWGRETCGNIECFADSNVPPEYHGYEWFCPNGERGQSKNVHKV